MTFARARRRAYLAFDHTVDYLLDRVCEALMKPKPFNPYAHQKFYGRKFIPTLRDKAFMDCPLVLVEGFPLATREYGGKPMTRTDANWRVN